MVRRAFSAPQQRCNDAAKKRKNKVATKKATTTEVSVLELKTESFDVWVIGESPLIHNAMSAKARQQLLMPPRKKTAADRAGSLKHEPYPEFVRSMYTARSSDSDTLVVVKSTAFKKAVMGAALDLPGANKTQIGRLLYVEGIDSSDEIGIYGVPEMMMSVTRSADANRTPDVRTRAIFPTWCAKIRVTYAVPLLNQRTVGNLIGAAGITQGIGDWRVEKGSGNYGRFAIAPGDHPVIQLLRDTGGRKSQAAAIKSPVYYDSETEELSQWFDDEVKRRGMEKLLTPKPELAEV
jgi:hypothetical protein